MERELHAGTTAAALYLRCVYALWLHCRDIVDATIAGSLWARGKPFVPFDLAIALHACGQASDAVILQAVERSVPYIVSPCCIGNVKFSLNKGRRRRRRGRKGNDASQQKKMGFIAHEAQKKEGIWIPLKYPRSRWLDGELHRCLQDKAKEYIDNGELLSWDGEAVEKDHRKII